MANVLIFAEQTKGKLRKATLHAIGAGREVARRTGGKLQLALLGKGVGALAEELAAYGADVHLIDAPGLESYLCETYAPVLAELAGATGAAFVGAASTAMGKDLMPRVAARLGAAMASDVLALSGEGTEVRFVRPMWAGNALAEVELATPVKVFTIRMTEFAPAPREGQGRILPGSAPVGPGSARKRLVGFQEVKTARPALTEARVVVAGGRGTKGDFKEIEALADELGAAVGATRAAVDAGWVPSDWQIGQTGKVVAPELYIGAGVSGAIQHLSGMKGAKVIVAINKDPEAPIFQLADYGLVADLFDALPKLRARVKAAR